LLNCGSSREKKVSSLLWVPSEELSFWDPIYLIVQLLGWVILLERAWVHEVSVYLWTSTRPVGSLRGIQGEFWSLVVFSLWSKHRWEEEQRKLVVTVKIMSLMQPLLQSWCWCYDPNNRKRIYPFRLSPFFGDTKAQFQKSDLIPILFLLIEIETGNFNLPNQTLAQSW
jgi:hypothetical protein